MLSLPTDLVSNIIDFLPAKEAKTNVLQTSDTFTKDLKLRKHIDQNGIYEKERKDIFNLFRDPKELLNRLKWGQYQNHHKYICQRFSQFDHPYALPLLLEVIHPPWNPIDFYIEFENKPTGWAWPVFTKILFMDSRFRIPEYGSFSPDAITYYRTRILNVAKGMGLLCCEKETHLYWSIVYVIAYLAEKKGVEMARDIVDEVVYEKVLNAPHLWINLLIHPHTYTFPYFLKAKQITDLRIYYDLLDLIMKALDEEHFNKYHFGALTSNLGAGIASLSRVLSQQCDLRKYCIHMSNVNAAPQYKEECLRFLALEPLTKNT